MVVQMAKTCPCCGGEINGSLEIEALKVIPLSRMKSAIVAAYVDAYPRPVNITYLIGRVYEHDPDGGPDGPANSIAATLARLRPEIEKYGWRISLFKGNSHGDNFSRLEPIGDQ